MRVLSRTAYALRHPDWLFVWMLVLLAATIGVYSYYTYYIHYDAGYVSPYKYLGKSFVKGHIDLGVPPDQMLKTLADPYDPAANQPYRWHDMSYYKNKYYLYFGPVPALTVWVPIRLLTGVEVGDSEMTLVLCSAGTASLFMLIYLLGVKQRVHNWPLRIGATSAWLVVGLGTWLPFILRRPFLYEVAIAGAYAYSALGLVFLFLYLQHRRHYWLLALASMSFGLSVGCRVTHIFNGVLLLLVLAQLLRERANARTLAAAFLAMALPMGVCLGALGVYNYERFESPFESGWHHQLAKYPQHDPSFRALTPELMPRHAYRYLFEPLQWRTPVTFPFFIKEGDWPGQYDPDAEPLYGVFTNNPFILFFACAFVCAGVRRSLSANAKLMMAGLVCYALLEFTLLCAFFSSTERYVIDFAPWLMAAAAVAYLHLLQNARHTRTVLALGALLAAYSIFTSTMSGYCGYTAPC